MEGGEAYFILLQITKTKFGDKKENSNHIQIYRTKLLAQNCCKKTIDPKEKTHKRGRIIR